MRAAWLRPRPKNASAPGPLGVLPEVTVVTAQGCHLCAEAVAELGARPDELVLTVVPADTPAGRELVRLHRPVMFPLVLVDGAFLSSGRLARRKLDKALASRGRRAVMS